jgi:hypothetical protein
MTAIHTGSHGVGEFLWGDTRIPRERLPRHFSKRLCEVFMVLGGGGNNQTLFRRVSAEKLVAAEVSTRAQHNQGGVSRERHDLVPGGRSTDEDSVGVFTQRSQESSIRSPGELRGRSLGANCVARRVGDHDGPSAVIPIWSIHLDERPM